MGWGLSVQGGIVPALRGLQRRAAWQGPRTLRGALLFAAGQWCTPTHLGGVVGAGGQADVDAVVHVVGRVPEGTRGVQGMRGAGALQTDAATTTQPHARTHASTHALHTYAPPPAHPPHPATTGAPPT